MALCMSVHFAARVQTRLGDIALALRPRAPRDICDAQLNGAGQRATQRIGTVGIPLRWAPILRCERRARPVPGRYSKHTLNYICCSACYYCLTAFAKQVRIQLLTVCDMLDEPMLEGCV